jgi:thiol-disulfide isomerase/thioredoxin
MEDNYFDDNKFITELSPKSFDDFTSTNLKDKNTGLLLYYAPWCGFCKRLKDNYIEASETSGLLCDFMALNCESHSSQYEKIKTEFPGFITGFPTIIVYNNGVPEYKLNEDDRSISKLIEIAMEHKTKRNK